MAFSKSIWKGQTPINCQLCETEKVIKWKCIQCSLLMCYNCCDKIHPKFRNAKEHKIININDLGAHQEELDFTNIKCEAHSGQPSCLFCRTCDILVCPTCVSKVHKKHDLIEIREAFNIKMERLKECRSEIQKDKKYMVMKKHYLDKLIVAENSKHTKVRQDILTHGKALHKAVDIYIEKLGNDLDQAKKGILSIEQDLKTIISFIFEVEYKKDEIEDLINTSNTSKFFTEIQRIEKSMEKLTPNTKQRYLSVPIFNPGEITQSNVGVLQSEVKPSAELGVAIVINNTYQINLSSVEYLCSDTDTTLWIGSQTDKVIKKVKPTENKLKIISSMSTKVYYVAVTQSNNLLLISKGESRLKQISSNSGKLTYSVYNMSPLLPTVVCPTSDNKVLVGGGNKDFPNPGRRVVILMNQNGDHERVYEHDQHKQPIFTYPIRITSTSNGNIHVVDKVSGDRGRVVVLGQGGDIINIYTGDDEINKDKPFKPADIVTTLRDNVIIADVNTDTLHILNNAGLLMTYYNTSDINISYPYCLAFNPTGQLYIGCTRLIGSTTKDAKIYEVIISGC